MAPLDERTLLLWLAIVLLVVLVTVTGMLLNRFFTYRAHRRALAALHESQLLSPVRVKVQDSYVPVD